MTELNPKISNLSDKTYHRTHRPRRKLLATAISALIAGTSAPLLAAENRELEEVIVTATKRSESVMDVPLAITAVSGEFIKDRNLDDVKDLVAYTPGITGNSKDSFLDFISVRGIRTIDFGNGGDPSISIFKNGLYQGRTGSAVVSLFDIDRAEVLRGPQGFMFGRNSVSGAMNVITTKANLGESDGYLDLDIGQRGHVVAEGAVNIPVSDNFAIRLSAYSSQEDGYVKNLQGGPDLIAHEKSAFRFSSHYENDDLTIDFLAEVEDRDQTGTVYRATGNGDAFNIIQTRINGGVPYEVSDDSRTVNVDNSLGSVDGGDILSLGLQVEFDLGFAILSSSTGYKDHTYEYIEDYDGTPTVLFNYGQDQEGDYFEQELRLTSNTDGPLSWYAGASYYNEDIDTVFLGQQAEDAYCLGYWADTCQGMFDYYHYLDDNFGTTYVEDLLIPYFGTDTWAYSPDGLINDRNRILGKFSGYSAYVDIGYEFTESFDMNFGLRYNSDEKDFSQQSLPDSGNSVLAYKVQTGFQTLNGPVKETRDWSETTFRVVANWHPVDSTLVFGSLTTGYKPGGFSSFAITQTGADALWGRYVATPEDKPASFDPETVTSYDIGFKSKLFDGLAQLSVSAFFYDYEDLQALHYEGAKVIVENVGQIDGRGLEVELNASLSENINLKFGGSWFDSEAVNVQAFCGDGERVTGDINVCEGNSIPWAPELTAYAVLNAVYPVGNAEIYGTIGWTWEEGTRVDWPTTDIVSQELEGINQADIQVGYRMDQWRVIAYVENAFDSEWYDAAYATSDPAVPYVEQTFGPSRPRTAGLRFEYQF